MRRDRTIILGGGIVGLSSAYFLARRGETATVIERDGLASGASSGNAGIIAAGHQPLPRPGFLGKSIMMLLDRNGPLYVKPRLDPDLLRWFFGFRRACRPETYRRSMTALCAVGKEALDCFSRIVADENIDCEYSPTGWMEVYNSKTGFEQGKMTAEEARGFGYRADILSPDNLQERGEPFSEKVVGAVHFTDSAFADPERFVRQLSGRVEKQGASVLTETEVSRIEAVDGRFIAVETSTGDRIEGDRLVLAAGAWTTCLASSIGLRVPMQAAKGYHMDLAGVRRRISTTSVLAERFVAVTPIRSGLRLAGTVELSGLNLDIVARRLNRLLAGARLYLDGLDEVRAESTWCGLRPMTADGLPVIGPAPGMSNIYIATGHAMMGFLLGPLTGKIISELILDSQACVDISHFLPDRLF